MTRYDELLTLIDEYKPKRLLEIGVWNGQNAIRMINQASKHNQFIEYLGYDLFEDATSETDSIEFNVKGHNQHRAVTAEIRAAIPKDASMLLVKGNTRETLSEGMTRDFVFLDGGHSIETIASDFERVKNSAVVVLDDYYTPDEGGAMPDIKKYGCNSLVADFPHRLMEVKDRVKGGGFTQLVVICRK